MIPEKNLLFSNEYSSQNPLRVVQSTSNREQKLKKYIKNTVIFIALATALYFLIKYKNFVSSLLERKALIVRESGALGLVITASLVFLFCFPVILGFGALQYLIGFVYGPLIGVAIICPSMFAGSSLCYYLFSHSRLQKTGKSMLERNEYFSTVAKLFVKRPLKMTILCRASSLPFVSVSVLLSVLRVEYWQYFVGMIIVLGKATLHMYIGSLASSNVVTSLKYTIIGLTIVLNFGIGGICGKMIQKELEKRTNPMIVVPF